MRADTLDVYLRMFERTTRDTMYKFVKAITLVYAERYINQPMINDVQQLYMMHENKHGFWGT